MNALTPLAPISGRVTTPAAARLLRCSAARLRYLVRTRQLVEPARLGGERRWGVADLLAARAALRRVRRGRRPKGDAAQAGRSVVR